MTRGVRSFQAALAGIAGIEVFGRRPAEFEEGIARVGTLGTEARNALAGFRDEVLRIGAESGTAFEELNAGLFNAISAGVEASDAIGLLETANRLAIAGSSDLGVTVSGLTTVLQTYRGQITTADEAARQLFATQVVGKTTLQEVSSAIGTVAGQASEAGIEFEELSASIALLTREGLEANRATTAIRASINAILKPPKKLAALMEQAGVAQGRAAFEGRSMGQVFGQIAGTANRLGVSLEELGVPQEALIGFYSLGREEGAAFEAILRDQQAALEELVPSYELMADTLSRNAREAKNLGLAIANELATPLLGELNQELSGFTGNVQITLLEFRKLGAQAARVLLQIRKAVAVFSAGFQVAFGTITGTAREAFFTLRAVVGKVLNEILSGVVTRVAEAQAFISRNVSGADLILGSEEEINARLAATLQGFREKVDEFETERQNASRALTRELQKIEADRNRAIDNAEVRRIRLLNDILDIEQQIDRILDLELGDLVEVTAATPVGWTITDETHVQRIAWEVDGLGGWSCRLRLDDAFA